MYLAVLRIRIRDEPTYIHELPTFLQLINHSFGLKYFYSLMRILDPGCKHSDPETGMAKSLILVKHSRSATLLPSKEIPKCNGSGTLKNTDTWF
jgi:hypothetical protein